MDSLISLIRENETWLVRRILAYAKERDYTRHTSTLEEAWRMSISGLSRSLVEGLRQFGDVPHFGPEDDFESDPMTAFGIIEAQRHRKRGISLSMFLGLMKYYRQTYVDLLREVGDFGSGTGHMRMFLDRSFDRIEIAFCQEWAKTGEEERIRELQSSNRIMTNEKNAYLTVFESLSDPVILLDRDHRIVNLNLAASHLSDPDPTPGESYYESAHRGRPVLELFPWLAEALQLEEDQPSEKTGIHECMAEIGGKVRFFEVKYSRMLDVSEKFTAAILSFRDVTVRRLTERALRSSEAKYRNLLENLPQKVFYKNRDSAYVAVNPSFAADFYLLPEDFVGKTDHDLFPAELAGKYRYDDTIILQTGKTLEFDEEYVRHDRKRTVHTLKAPVRDDVGEIVGVLGILWDITDRKEAEAELVRAREAAEAASSAKDRFLSTMSHELRTPLNVVLGLAEVLGETELDSGQEQFLRLLSSAGEDLLSVINNVLDLSKIESGKMKFEDLGFLPRRVVEETCEIFKVQAREKGLELRWKIDPEADTTVIGDPHRLRQVLVNLIGNAIKFTERGGVEVEVVRISAGEPDSCRAALRFSVSDTGIGIPREACDTIFDSFTQVDSSTTRRFGGTGLGLAISRSLVEQMGGSIGVVSESGEGSRFEFTAEFATASTDRSAGEEPVGNSVDLSIVPHSRILLVEDSESNQVVVKAFLDNEPVELDIAGNGRDGLEKFKAGAYDLVLMDMEMPVMDGYRAVGAIRDWEREQGLARTPVLAITAHALGDQAERCVEAGCDGCLTKPMKKASFRRKVASFLGDRWNDAELVDVDPVLAPHVPGFLRSVNDGLAAIENHLENEEFDPIRILGHKMKGDGGTYGFDGVTRCGSLIESAAAERRSDEIRNQLRRLSDYLERVGVPGSANTGGGVKGDAACGS